MKYVLALQNADKIHVGETADVIQHIGRGVDGSDFKSSRVVDFGEEFELYDEEAYRLEVQVDGGDVTIVRTDPEEQVSAPSLLSRINQVLEKAQASLDAARQDATEAAAAAAGEAVEASRNGSRAEADIQGVVQNVADVIAQARPFWAISPYPYIRAELHVVLAALTEDFGSEIHGGPPHYKNKHHWQLHLDGYTH